MGIRQQKRIKVRRELKLSQACPFSRDVKGEYVHTHYINTFYELQTQIYVNLDFSICVPPERFKTHAYLILSTNSLNATEYYKRVRSVSYSRQNLLEVTCPHDIALILGAWPLHVTFMNALDD